MVGVKRRAGRVRLWLVCRPDGSLVNVPAATREQAQALAQTRYRSPAPAPRAPRVPVDASEEDDDES